LEDIKSDPPQEDSAIKAKPSLEELRLRVQQALTQRGGPEVIRHWLGADDGKHA
jgi:hypothetical protein